MRAVHSMHPLRAPSTEGCAGCRSEVAAPDIAFAFQPIVDLANGTIFAHEALVRGPNGESAASVLAQVDDDNRYRFDQQCRTVAIGQAAALDLQGALSINFMPNAVYRAEACLRSTLAAARTHGFPIERIIFETVESEHVGDHAHFIEVFRAYKRLGFRTAIDDFGSGYSGLNLLVDFQPDLVKLDMKLLRGIDTDRVRQRIVAGALAICRDLGITVIAEGIETRGERDYLADQGVSLMQGYFFARPAFQATPQVPADTLRRVA